MVYATSSQNYVMIKWMKSSKIKKERKKPLKLHKIGTKIIEKCWYEKSLYKTNKLPLKARIVFIGNEMNDKKTYVRINVLSVTVQFYTVDIGQYVLLGQT